MAAGLRGQQKGLVRGEVTDSDFGGGLPGVRVSIVETEQSTTSDDTGRFVIEGIMPGVYTVIFGKTGYVRQIKSGVTIRPGSLTELKVGMTAEYEDLEEFVVQEPLELTGGSEESLLQMRFESPALMDSIGSDFISRSGASDAADALTLVSGATVKNGKSAVIRGLPDRYVSSQMNGVRLPSADEDKRAVELDQFPSAIIESIQVTKTFTPDQQGDASGGAVNLKLKGIPNDVFFNFKGEYSFNSQVIGESDFLSYEGGGFDFLGGDSGDRDIQFSRLGQSWAGAVGVSTEEAPIDYKWSLAGGGKLDLGDGFEIGGFGSLFYERDSSFHDNGQENAFWIDTPGGPLVPQAFQGSVQDGDFKTGLFDITRARKSVQWGALATVGVDYEDSQSLRLTYLFTKTTEDTATLAEDTRGKEFFFPGYDPNDPTTPGHDEVDAAPYLRLETLSYRERTTETFQISGENKLPIGEFAIGDSLVFRAPVIDWTVAFSSAGLDEPDKRQFGSVWFPAREPFPGLVIPATHRPFKPAANFNLGNLQRIFKEINEESDQYQVNLTLPFTQWSGDEGFFKLGYFNDSVKRDFRQESFSNFGDAAAVFEGPFDEFWSASFPAENHPISASEFDVDYEGQIDVDAYYAMLRIPVVTDLELIGGVRVESTKISIVNMPESSATWFPIGSAAPTTLNAGDADVDFEETTLLPSVGVQFEPVENITLRTSYSETIARQTFKELTPILQQEFLGGDIFIGNPGLDPSRVQNYDVRVEWTPYEGGLVSASWFLKKIKDPIEYVKRLATFNFTTAVNYPRGEISGFEFEVRQDLGHFIEALQGLTIGGNATFIDSEVELPATDIAAFADPGIGVDLTKRRATNTPESLFNVYLAYDWEKAGTLFSLFYTVTGDTLVAGAGESSGNFVPNEYAASFDTLNLTVTQDIAEHFKIQFKAKNLTNPEIRRVFRTDDGRGSALKSSFTEGVEFSLSLTGEFRF